MSILKALQKKQSEQSPDAADTISTSNVVAFEKNARRAAGAGKNAPPDLFAGGDVKIGKPAANGGGGGRIKDAELQ